MRLPSTDEAVIPKAKVADYLLSLSHPDGRGKAIFFMRFGFNTQTWETLADALREHARANDVTKTEATPFGTRYVVEGALTAPDARSPNVRTVWFMDAKGNVPRFVTAYPLDAPPPSVATLPRKEQNNGTGTR